MSRDYIDDFALQMREVDMPASAYRRIEDAIGRAARTEVERAPRISRRALVLGFSAGAAALAVGAIGIGQLAPWLTGTPSQGFTLAAYADGTDGEGRVGIDIGPEFLSGGYWSYGTDGPFTEDGFGVIDTGVAPGYAVSLYFDLGVRGMHMASISYEIEEGDAYFRFDPHSDPDTMPDGFTPRGYTIAPGELDTLLPPFKKGRIYLMANIPLDAASVHGATEEDRLASAYEAAGAVIAASVLNVAVTFEDGSVEAHRYRIAPTDQLADAVHTLLENRPSPGPAFTIEQIG